MDVIHQGRKRAQKFSVYTVKRKRVNAVWKTEPASASMASSAGQSRRCRWFNADSASHMVMIRFRIH